MYVYIYMSDYYYCKFVTIISARQQFQYREEEIERPPTHPSGPPPEEEGEERLGHTSQL